MKNEQMERGDHLHRGIKRIIREIKRLKNINYEEKYKLFVCKIDNQIDYNFISNYTRDCFISEQLFNSVKNKLINDMRRKLVELQNEFDRL